MLRSARFGELGHVMGFGLLLLGLLPLALFANPFLSGGEDVRGEDAMEGTGREDPGDEADELLGDFADDEAIGPILKPVTEDDIPFAGEAVDPEMILSPVAEDEIVPPGADVDKSTILRPVETELGVGVQDANALQQRLATETYLNAGIRWLDDIGEEATVHTLGNEANEYSAHSGGVGEGRLNTIDGTPVLLSDGALHLVDGGDGAEVILGGDEATYLLGGSGHDTLAAGNGASALFGGTGNDMFSAGQTATFMDGGDGDDALLGGARDDVIFGGAHDDAKGTTHDDDLISGGGGNDLIAGGYGADVLDGGHGDDVIDHLGHAGDAVAWERHEFDWHIDSAQDDLSGGTGDDTLIMDRKDVAEGGEGTDTFWVYFDVDDGEGFAEIADFRPGQEVLRITLNPEFDLGGAKIRVGPAENGEDGVVTLDDQIVARLRGAANITPADVVVEAPSNIFA